ncbi:NTP-binding protein [Massilia violaceinigra]|uniref:NTP-binding protein n=1 Tax=Massilia violaceinigra TaxID=2045208 RepID=A0A2D2DE21_9BURK|nr:MULTISPECIES: STAS domain-containing protein [Massilia]ATQ73238.1 NTP-binding protein [Massilia violaceinigra]MDQ1920518.1 STAS domain-containing protein [Massilia sp. CCM 9206]
MVQTNKLENIDTLTVHNAKAALVQGFDAINAGQTVFDFGSVKVADSSAVAVLLAWQRAARTAGVVLSYVNLPVSLKSLAALYGVDAFLVDTPANLHHH